MIKYEHDCESCIFVGFDAPQAGEPRTNQVDMYIHVSKNRKVAIRRYSSRPDDYGAMDAPVQIPAYQRVVTAYNRNE